MKIMTDLLQKIRNGIDRRNDTEEQETVVLEGTNYEATQDVGEPEPETACDAWMADAAENGFQPSPEKQSSPDVLVVTSDGIKER